MAPRRPKKGGFRRKKEEPYRVNHRIKAPMVRLVGENVNVGIYPIEEARAMADEQELDLVEISPSANPPVCKIIDYRKFLYEKKKKEKEIKQKTAKVQVKEIRMGPNTDEHDFNFKLNHAKKFLSEGNKVKAEVFFKGRTIIYKDQGKYKLLKFADELEDFGKVESMPKMEGKRMIMMISPKKTK